MIERLTASLEEKTLALSAAHDGYIHSVEFPLLALVCTAGHCLVEMRWVQHCTYCSVAARRSDSILFHG